MVLTVPPNFQASMKGFDGAVRSQPPDWPLAFRHLNGLNMHDMLRALDALPAPLRDALWANRGPNIYPGEEPRMQYAVNVVGNRQLPGAPSAAPGDLFPTGQVGDALEFLAQVLGRNFPPRPNFQQLGLAEKQQLFGRFTFVANPIPGNPENITIQGTWERDNIVFVDLPQLAGVRGAARRARFHRLAAPQLTALWRDWERGGVLDHVLTSQGFFVPRFVRGSRTNLSNHAFGTAFDINFQWNQLGQQPALGGSTGCVRELVPIAHEHGFFWGGHFDRLDGNHFEVAQLR